MAITALLNIQLFFVAFMVGVMIGVISGWVKQEKRKNMKVRSTRGRNGLKED